MAEKNNEKYIAVVGFGEIGKRNTKEQLVTCPIKVEAVVEPDDKKYEDGCKWIKQTPKRYQNAQQLLEDEKNKKIRKLDGVMISTPNHTHLGVLRLFEKHDIPIFLEKPLDSSFEKICDVVRFAEKYKNRILVHHCMRYAPILMKAKELIDSNAIGKVCSSNYVQNCFYGNYMFRSFRRTMEGSGGYFVEKATHDFDIMQYLMPAKAVRIAAISKRQEFGGNKPDDLVCSKCDERFSCRESKNNMLYRFGEDSEGEAAWGDESCVYAKCVDVPDNETCMIEFDNGTFGTYSQCFFSPVSYDTRVYEIIGLEGIMRINLSIVGNHSKGKILLCPRYGTPEDRYEFDFDYRNRIHYNAGGPVAMHFYELMLNKDVKPFTTVQQAFVSELIAYCATLAAQQKKMIAVDEIVPGDLKHLL